MKTTLLYFLIPISLLVATPLQAADWPMWGRTADRNMVAPGGSAPSQFDPGQLNLETEEVIEDTMKGILWVEKLGSQTYGNPSVAEGKVIVGTNNASPRDPEVTEDRGIVICFDEKTGEMLWQLNIPKLGAGKVSDWEYIGICSSAAIEDGYVYVTTNRCEVIKLDIDGLADGNDGPYKDEEQYKRSPLNAKDADIIWIFDMRTELGVFPHNVTGGSPLIVGDYVYATTSNGVDWSHTNIPSPLAPSMIVLDKQTGELVGEEMTGSGERILHASWSSPSFFPSDEKPQVILGAGDGWLYGFRPEPVAGPEGFPILKEFWRYDCNPRSYRFDENGKPRRYATFAGPSEVIGTPVAYNGKIYVPIGQDPEHGDGVGRMNCVDPMKSGLVSESATVWAYDGMGRSMSTPSIHDGLVYVAEYAGDIHCLDAETGEVYWVYETKSRVWSSTLYADGKVYLGNEDGDLHILRAGKELEVVNVIPFGIPIYSSPVLANDVLYVATQTHLYAIDGE